MNLRAGVLLDDRYELIERLGQGGQGAVWKAFDRTTGEHRALKIVDLRGGDEETTRRAQREARLVRDLAHPALVACRAVLEIPREELLVLVFDFVEATPLSSAREDARFGRVHKLAALRHIAGALAHLHDKGIIHRDLKPDNILLTPRFWDDPAAPSSLKIIDFGIATPRRGPEGATLSGRFGTPAYMAPELFRSPGNDALRSPARDVFAFGVIGWELLDKGHPAELGRSSEYGVYAASYEHLRRGRAPWPPRPIEGMWGSVVGACLALDPAQRPLDGSAILTLLGEPPAASLSGGAGRASAPRAPVPPAIDGPTAPHVTPAPESTVASAPASRVLAATELALPSSLPRSTAPDRTTPMPPEVRSTQETPPTLVVVAPAIVSAPEAKPAAPAQTPPPTPEQGPSESRVPWIMALVLLVVTVVVVIFYASSSPSSGAAPSATPSVTVATSPPPEPSSPDVSAPADAGPDAATEDAGGPDGGAPASIEVCCGKDGKCSSGRECKLGSCNGEVPPSMSLLLRAFLVEKQPDPYSAKKNLADGDSYPDSQVCVRTLRDPPSADEICVPMATVVSAKTLGPKASSPPKRLAVTAQDIMVSGIGLRLKAGKRAVVETALQGTGNLRTTGLCTSLTMKDSSGEVFLTFYLDDPSPHAGSP